jgi:YYY domain-containing protein
MTASLSWYLASSLLGWLTFPLVFRLFPALTDRGYTLVRTVGLLLWGWLFWIFASLGVLRNDLGGLLFAFLVLLGLSLWSLMTDHWSLVTDIKHWLASHKPLILTTEILFILAFAFMAFVRASNPEAVATEKPMELAFINGILRSPTFPPNDPWMSGYSISYYHFGYIMTAMLARLTGVSGNVAFNLMLALVFALAAVGSFGILYNLLCAYTSKQVHRCTDTRVDTETGTQEDTDVGGHITCNSHPASPNSQLLSSNCPSSFVFLALLAPLFLLILSNPEGLLEVIHGLGWFWPSTSSLQPSTFNFWTWLNLKDLNLAPTGGGWIPTRFWWWWRASRVVSDFDLVNAYQEIIDEFPAFSFVLGDLHPHVLALPFNMLGIGVALNIFLDGWRGAIRFFELRLRTAPRDFLFTALVLGGLAFLNTWDILVTAALIVGAYILVRVRDDGWSWSRLEDVLLLGIPLVVTAIVFYLPFYLGFSSQAGGLLPNLVNPTRGAHLWVMWGTLLLPLFAFLIWLTRDRETRPRYGTALAWTLGGILFLWAFSWLLGLAAQWREPEFAAQYLASQNQPNVASLFSAATARRLSYIGGLLTIASILWLSLSHLLTVDRGLQTVDEATPTVHRPPSTVFVLLLILLASLLILAPDFVYLRDGFGYRINTVFKFYYQAWQLWSLAAAFGTAVLLRNLRGVWNVVWRVVLGLILIAGLAYPVLAFLNKTENFKPRLGYNLDSSAHLENDNPEDAAAIRYLQSAPLGVVAEAIGGSYSYHARISTHTGLPTVLGWSWHEYQWRGDWSAHGTRETDIQALYEAPDWDNARAIIDRYQIRYIVVGLLERTTYDLSETKFQQHLVVLFQAGNTIVYGVP